jgi:hypothetical protein
MQRMVAVGWVWGSVWEYFAGWSIGSELVDWGGVVDGDVISSVEDIYASLERFAMLGISARRAVCCTVPAYARGLLCSSSSTRRELRAKG